MVITATFFHWSAAAPVDPTDQELSIAADFMHEDQCVCEEVRDQCVHEEVIEESKLVSSFHAFLLGLPITQYQILLAE